MIDLKEKMKDLGYGSIEKKVNENFKEAMQDAEFCQFVKEIPLEEEVLKNYTLTLQEAYLEHQHCKECSNIMECKNKVIGYAYSFKVVDGMLFFPYLPCLFKRDLEEKNSYQKYITTFGGKKNLPCGFSEVETKYASRKETVLWLLSFLKKYKKERKGKGLYLHGSFGGGKSYLVTALFTELAKEKVESVIVFWPEFLRNLKSSFESDFEQKINKIKKAPLLLIDDIGAENTTAWNRDEILCPILQYRMDHALSTFFTSNLDLKLLEEHLSNSKSGVEEMKARRVLSRIEQLTDVLEMNHTNLRK